MISLKNSPLSMGNLKAKIPIIQGGMGIGISLSGLASAVANEGGIGVISAAGIGLFEKDSNSNYLEANIRALKNEIRKARELTKGILGVNIMVALSDFEELVKTSIEEGIDVIFSGAGLPLNLPKFLTKSSKTKLVPIVSSARAAALITKKWMTKYDYAPDAIVVEGPLAGGHLGFKEEEIEDEKFKLEHIVKDVMEKIKSLEVSKVKNIPVIAAGGIFNGKDIKKFIDMGVDGVQMATRFVTTKECDASIDFKNSYINCDKEDIGIIKSPVGMPGRAIINNYLKDVNNGIKKPYSCPYHCIVTCNYKDSAYCIALSLKNAKLGKLTHGFAFAGENTYKTDEIITVKELINKLEVELNSEEPKE
ncbi:MAG: nitronate monooxygenase [Clostridiales bacterium]